MNKPNGWYGWIPDRPDRRDLHYASPRRRLLASLPAKVDLRPGMPPVYDQGDLGSCTANAIAAAMQFDQIKQKCRTQFTPSRLFIYYNERVMEGTIGEDAGAMIRDGIKSVKELGAPAEKSWPYVIDRFSKRPTKAAYRSATAHQTLRYERVGQNEDIKECLAEGYPVVFGFTVYSSFEGDVVAQTGVLEMPGPGEHDEGGHAVLACGYDEDRRMFLVRNSWAEDWGEAGYFWLPYEYVLDNDLCDDFWTIRTVEGR